MAGKNRISSFLITFFWGVFAACILMLLVYMLPTRLMEDNLRESAALIESEGIYPTLFDGFAVRMHPDNAFELDTLLYNNRITARDNWTDSIMLSIAGYDGSGGVIEKAAAAYRWTDRGGNAVTSLAEKYIDDENSGRTLKRVSYPRYWHGYLVFLKPLLLVFGLSQIRMLNLLILGGLFIYQGFLIKKELGGTALGLYLYSVLFYFPFTVPFCMQYCTATFVTLVAGIFMFHKYEDLGENDGFMKMFFFTGMCVAFIDFLTFPVVTFGIPFIFYLLLGKTCRMKETIKDMLAYGTCWLTGYAGMWAAKWVIASAVLGEDVVAEAVRQVMYRASGVPDAGEQKITAWRAVASNICNYVNIVYIMLIFAGLCGIIAAYRKRGGQKKGSECGIYVITAVMPFIWYCLFKNHSYGHGSFTFRALTVSVFSVMCFFHAPFKAEGKSDG